ncbi:MAG: Uma2 family endonuclease [Isosphaeraceae bacterium]
MNAASSATPASATLAALARTSGKAELIGARIVPLLPTGRQPSRIAFRIARSLDDYSEASGRGEAYADNTGFIVPKLASGRQSFAPDASYKFGPFSANEMRCLDGAPVFAVEVRSEHDYGPAAEAQMAAKRADYFEAGTAIVWDVDPLSETVYAYQADSSESPVIYQRGDVADAEPALPGWRITIDQVFG